MTKKDNLRLKFILRSQFFYYPLIIFNPLILLNLLFVLLLTFISSCGPDYSKFVLYPDYKPGEILLSVDSTFSQNIQKADVFDQNTIPVRYTETLWQSSPKTTQNQKQILKLSVPQDADIMKITTRLEQLDGVIAAEPNWYNHLFTNYNLKRLNNYRAVFNDHQDNNLDTRLNNYQDNNLDTRLNHHLDNYRTSLTTKEDSNNDFIIDSSQVGNHVPEDKYYLSHQFFYLNTISIPQVWDLMINGNGLTINTESTDDEESTTNSFGYPIGIAVLDSGVDFHHEDLVGRFLVNGKEGLNKGEELVIDEFLNGVDDDNNGYIDDVFGLNVHDSSIQPVDELNCKFATNPDACKMTVGHGTHVAGLIGAAHNDKGIAGICQTCYISAIKVIDENGTIPDDYVVKALKYASEFAGGVIKILNFSFGKYVKSRAMYNIIEELQDNLLIIAAGGNEDTERPSYPAAIPSTLAVSAIGGIGKSTILKNAEGEYVWDYYLQKAGFSNFGTHIDISAPGMMILSSVPTNHPEQDNCKANKLYCEKSGTSQAAPIVAGIAGLYLSFSLADYQLKNPDSDIDKLNIHPAVIKKRLLSTADASFYQKGYNAQYQSNYDASNPTKVESGKQYIGTGLIHAFNVLLGYDSDSLSSPTIASDRFTNSFLGCSINTYYTNKAFPAFLSFLIILISTLFLIWLLKTNEK